MGALCLGHVREQSSVRADNREMTPTGPPWSGARLSGSALGGKGRLWAETRGDGRQGRT